MRSSRNISTIDRIRASISGCNDADSRKILTDYIESNGLEIIALLNTHCHIDHVLGNQFVSEKYKLPLQAHKNEVMVLDMAPMIAEMYGVSYLPSPHITIFLEANESKTIASMKFKMLFCPGHSPGSLCFYFEEQGFVIGGDVLFQGSIGRTDLPGGNHDDLISSIRNELFVLPGKTVVYPGHGEPTTIARELSTNPFFN